MKKGSFALRLFLYASLVSLIWLGGYVLLSEVFAVEETVPEKPSEEIRTEAELPATSSARWSALAVTDEAGEVTEFLFRYGDFVSDALVFIRVPVNTKVELENGGYEVLRVHNPELPKLFMVSDLCRIFSGETLCMALEEIGVALFGIRPKDCYIMEQVTYEQLTEPVDGRRQFTSGGSVKETVKTALAHSLTTASLEEEMLYWESYLDVDKVVYTILPGTASAQEYRPDKAEIQRMVQNLQAGLFEENYEGQE